MVAATVIVLAVGGSALGDPAAAQQGITLPLTSLDSFSDPDGLHYSSDIALSPGTYTLEVVFQAQDCALADGQRLTVLNAGPEVRGEDSLNPNNFAGSIEYLIRLSVPSHVAVTCEAAYYGTPVVVQMTATQVQLQ